MPKHIHFIGICGVGMGALAICMKNKGWDVTGSDVGFYPPISTHLQNNHIAYYAGWHPEKMGKPDLVVVGNVAGSENPEFLFVQKNNIPYVSYPELIARELVHTNSIVCAGTYGKTSTTALLSWMLINADKKPAYMFGALSGTPELAADDLGGEWSVLEGDEYKTSRWDSGPKFFHYSPTHLLLTAVQWDHADVYPTEKDYYSVFEKLLSSIPPTGLTVMSENVPTEIADRAQENKIIYGRTARCDYYYTDIISSPLGLEFTIKFQNTEFRIHTNLLGEYQAENICGAFALAHQIGIAPEKIIESIKSFGGIKRRLEKRGMTKTGAIIFDDIAHSPIKVRSVLETLRKIYTGKIFCVFEPNSGNRKPEAEPQYAGAFTAANMVLIPHLTKLKNDAEFISGETLADIINRGGGQAVYVAEDTELIQYLKTNATTGDIIIFCGSHGFRGMIEAIIQ